MGQGLSSAGTRCGVTSQGLVILSGDPKCWHVSVGLFLRRGSQHRTDYKVQSSSVLFEENKPAGCCPWSRGKETRSLWCVGRFSPNPSVSGKMPHPYFQLACVPESRASLVQPPRVNSLVLLVERGWSRPFYMGRETSPGVALLLVESPDKSFFSAPPTPRSEVSFPEPFKGFSASPRTVGTFLTGLTPLVGEVSICFLASLLSPSFLQLVCPRGTVLFDPFALNFPCTFYYKHGNGKSLKSCVVTWMMQERLCEILLRGPSSKKMPWPSIRSLVKT